MVKAPRTAGSKDGTPRIALTLVPMQFCHAAMPGRKASECDPNQLGKLILGDGLQGESPALRAIPKDLRLSLVELHSLRRRFNKPEMAEVVINNLDASAKKAVGPYTPMALFDGSVPDALGVVNTSWAVVSADADIAIMYASRFTKSGDYTSMIEIFRRAPGGWRRAGEAEI